MVLLHRKTILPEALMLLLNSCSLYGFGILSMKYSYLLILSSQYTQNIEINLRVSPKAYFSSVNPNQQYTKYSLIF